VPAHHRAGKGRMGGLGRPLAYEDVELVHAQEVRLAP
jgi:hypothetical protein